MHTHECERGNGDRGDHDAVEKWGVDVTLSWASGDVGRPLLTNSERRQNIHYSWVS